MVDSEISPPKSYSQEEIQQIIRLAITRQSHQEDFSREQLWEIALELDIPIECMQAAERDWLQERLVTQERQEFNQYRQGKFKHKAGQYLIINIFLLTIDLLSSGSLSWSLYCSLAFGMVIALSAWRTYYTNGEAYEQAFQRWERKRQLKQSVQNLWHTLQKAWQG